MAVPSGPAPSAVPAEGLLPCLQPRWKPPCPRSSTQTPNRVLGAPGTAARVGCGAGMFLLPSVRARSCPTGARDAPGGCWTGIHPHPGWEEEESELCCSDFPMGEVHFVSTKVLWGGTRGRVAPPSPTDLPWHGFGVTADVRGDTGMEGCSALKACCNQLEEKIFLLVCFYL